jgi:hypothetical protein
MDSRGQTWFRVELVKLRDAASQEYFLADRTKHLIENTSGNGPCQLFCVADGYVEEKSFLRPARKIKMKEHFGGPSPRIQI